jgi:hypothetical protein
LTQDNKELIKAIDKLNENIDFLTKVTALSLRKESLFSKADTKQQQVEALEPLDLPDRIIAVIVGSTTDSVKSLRSQLKGKAKKPAKDEPNHEEVKKVE